MYLLGGHGFPDGSLGQMVRPWCWKVCMDDHLIWEQIQRQNLRSHRGGSSNMQLRQETAMDIQWEDTSRIEAWQPTLTWHTWAYWLDYMTRSSVATQRELCLDQAQPAICLGVIAQWPSCGPTCCECTHTIPAWKSQAREKERKDNLLFWEPPWNHCRPAQALLNRWAEGDTSI